MKKFFRIIFDKSVLIFICVGALNTLLSAAMMFLLYNTLRWGYWPSTATAYVLTSILSFVLNKRFTFSHKGSVLKSALRFAIVIGVCYLIAFKAAQPLTQLLLPMFFNHNTLSIKQLDNVSMLVGMVIFTGLNYFGQRFFAFRKDAPPDKGE